MKDRMVYYLYLLIVFILILWSSLVLVIPPKTSPTIEDNVLIESTKTFNLAELHELAMYYGKLGR